MDSCATGNLIELADVRVERAGKTILQVASLAVSRSERVFVLGRSGSGKTTLARLIKGRIRPTEGTVRVLGQDPAALQPAIRRSLQRRIAMIDQEFFLIPRLSVVGNVLSGCLGRVSPWKSLIGWYPSSEWAQAEAILKEVELGGLEGRRVETLSGGQRQRTALARAVMQDAEIVLADEPISNLDPALAEDALELLVGCVERRGVTLVVNLHQPALARRFATRIVALVAGRVEYDGTPQGFPEAAQAVYQG